MERARRDHSNHSIELWLQNFLSHISRLADMLFPPRAYVVIAAAKVGLDRPATIVTDQISVACDRVLPAPNWPMSGRCRSRLKVCEKGRKWLLWDPHEYRPGNGRLGLAVLACLERYGLDHANRLTSHRRSSESQIPSRCTVAIKLPAYPDGGFLPPIIASAEVLHCTARTGRDMPRQWYCRPRQCFNPRARTGRDAFGCEQHPGGDVSIHAPVRGAT